MSLVEIKTDARRAIHAEFGVPVVYTDLAQDAFPSADQSAEGLVLTARFSTKARILAPDSDAVTIMENVDRLIFSSEQLDALALELEQGGLVQIDGYDMTLALDIPLDSDGPLNRYWTVTRATDIRWTRETW